jgi:hypothetical protein
MNPEVLTSLTAAKGVPLDGSRGATLKEMSELASWFRPGRNVGNTYVDGRVRWGAAKSTASSKKPEWTLAEAGVACHGLAEKYYLALRFSYALDDTALHRLRWLLMAYALREASLNDWPEKLPTLAGTVHYLQRLVDMALLEERHPSRFRQKDAKGKPIALGRIIMNVDQNVWYRKMEPIYETIVSQYRTWLSIGAGHMRKWLRA